MFSSKSFSGRTVAGRKVSGTVEIVKEGYKVTAKKVSVTYRRGEYGIVCMDDAVSTALLAGDI